MSLTPRIDTIEAIIDREFSPNLLINGAFDFWQRGTSPTTINTTATFLADRWICASTTASTTVSRVTDAPSGTGAKYAIQFDATSATSIVGTRHLLTQRVESLNTRALAGKTITLSWYFKSSVGGTVGSWVEGRTADAEDDYSSQTIFFNSNSTPLQITADGTWQRAEVTMDLDGVPDIENGINFVISTDSDDIQNGTFLITGVMVQIGSAAGSFRRAGRNIGEELAMCQRYYCKSYNSNVAPGSIDADGAHRSNFARNASSQNYEMIYFPVEMRVAPITTMYNPSASNDDGRYYNYSDGAATTGTLASVQPNSMRASPATSSGVDLGDIWGFHYTADAEL